ncbi:MAG: protein kinase domain-containing protein [Myxococcota bacterium]
MTLARRARRGGRLLLLAAAVATAGCGSAAVLEVPEWTLLPPEGGPREVTLPGHLSSILPARRSTYRLHARVLVPPWLRHEPLTLTLPHLPGLVEAQGNGKPLTPLDQSHTSVYRTDGMHAFSVPTEMAGRMIRIDLLVHHQWAQSAWIHEPPRLSASDHGDRAYMGAVAFNRATDVAALVLLLSAGFTYLILFSLERTRRAHLFYAIQLIAAAAYPLFWSGLLQPILGPAEIPLLGVLLAVAAVAGVYCIHAYFDLETPSPAWIVGVGAVAVVAMIAPGPFESTRWVAAAALAVLATAASYLIVRLARIARAPRRPINTLTFLGCWVLLALCMAPDGLYWLGAWSGVPTTGGIHFASFGLATFAFLHTFAVSRELVVERRTEVEHLSTELQRQVGERSRDLQSAVAQLKYWSGGAPRALQPGETIDERYRTVGPLGRGGMGTVYEVQRITDGQHLALKLLQTAGNAAHVARFAREGEIATQVRHRNVVAVRDVGISQTGFMYLVMDLVQGGTLEEARDRFGDAAWALPLLRQVASGLAALHDASIVHRDLKPANVLLEVREGKTRARIADFGIANSAAVTVAQQAGTLAEASVSAAAAGGRSLAGASGAGAAWASYPRAGEDEDTLPPESFGSIPPAGSSGSLPPPGGPLTDAGVLMGTPLYMAPELRRGVNAASPASDVFSFAVLAYEMLAGAYPFAEPPLFDATRPDHAVPALPLQDACPSLPDDVAHLLTRCIEAPPHERPTAADLAHALATRRRMTKTSGIKVRDPK